MTLEELAARPRFNRHRQDLPVRARLQKCLRRRIPIPRATYRLQFHKGFGFWDAAALAPYLARLGISHVYASPYLKARPGSTHGYDIVDHGQLNPELGDELAFRDMVTAFRDSGLGQVLDFVPNHMGVGGADNPWWLDVLEWGPASEYAGWFDIDWDPDRRYLARQAAGAVPGRPVWGSAGSGPARAALRTGDRRLCRMGLRHAQAADLPAALPSRSWATSIRSSNGWVTPFPACRTGDRGLLSAPRICSPSSAHWRGSAAMCGRRCRPRSSGSTASPGDWRLGAS